MSILETILDILHQQKEKSAFFIQGKTYSYADLLIRTKTIYTELKKNVASREIIAITANDHIDTYAAILACWFHSCAFLPLSPQSPQERNAKVLEVAKASLIINTGNTLDTTSKQIFTKDLNDETSEFSLPMQDEQDLMYVLFTSGSTGTPKGVAINRRNLEAYVSNFFSLNMTLDENDRFLQMYDLTFDASVQVYLIPLLLGASIYTVPHNQPKYLYAYKLMKEQQLTVSKMVPSTLHLLKPYFASIKLEKLKYCIFGGEGLSIKLAEAWSKCAPNAILQNVYGPSETTVNCMIYQWNRAEENVGSNGILSIGKTFGDTEAIIVDENTNFSKEGELCLAGNQVFSGYLNQDALTEKSFLTINEKKYYKTGDQVSLAEDGNFLFLGRNDDQVKIQGFRVELSEIENLVMKTSVAKNSKVLVIENDLVLFVEQMAISVDSLMEKLSALLPGYMLPKKIINCGSFPLSISGKIDRMALKSLYLKENE